MPLTLAQMEEEGILQELAEYFPDGPAAGALLLKANVRITSFRPFGDPSIEGWWREVCRKIEHGQSVECTLETLVSMAADVVPGNRIFQQYLAETSKIENRDTKGGSINVVFPETYSPEDSCKLLDKLKEIALATGNDVIVNFGQAGSSRFNISIPDVESQEELERIAEHIETALNEENYRTDVQVEPYSFRDYYSDPITMEGPDGQEFAIDQIRASTTVKDLARGMMHQYSDDVWPSRKGHKTQAVVDRVTKGGKSTRLDPRKTLHDAGVRPGDTLKVSPERTAGAISPLMRDEALARVRNEVLAFAESHPDFEVEANSLVAPTEYLFRFQEKSFAQPVSLNSVPPFIEQHEVLVELPPDFPVKAPKAWWQTDIFHPNIDPVTGWVCLGALQKLYRPSMNFKELCQMLLDLAGYRNYAVTEGHNKEAAAWALSAEGQAAIEQIGGISVIGRMVMEGRPEQKLKIRKLQP
ncbi:MAG: hypothetical protein GY800_00990 [Planctomycetes bacterium]|nr:hypothetical protein [Planctomycetota bacterium]